MLRNSKDEIINELFHPKRFYLFGKNINELLTFHCLLYFLSDLKCTIIFKENNTY